MTLKEKLAEYQKEFANHKLTVEVETEKVKMYTFKNPEKSNLWQRWIITNNTLVVIGDAYESIYQSGAFESLKSIADCNLSYFSGKCVADRDGYQQSKFDGDKATECIHQMIIDRFEDLEIFEEDANIESKLSIIEKHIEKENNEYDYEIPRGFHDEYDTVIWLRENHHAIGHDWWDGLNLNKKNNHPFWHLGAIKEAVKQMELVTV